MKRFLLFHLMLLLGCTVMAGNHKSNSQKNVQYMNTEVPKISDFPVGNENTGYAQYFSGKSWLAPLTSNSELHVPVSNVTFEPGCRNNWHSHTGGQILIAVGGTGYYQERGKEAIRMVPGDVIEIAPNVEHWHGAAPDSWFSHLAIACNPQTNENIWLEPVNDEQYKEATASGQQEPTSKQENDMDRIEVCKHTYTTLFGGEALTGQGNDPELMDILQKYIFGEVFRVGDLDIKIREMITCVSLAAMQQLPQLKAHTVAALHVGVTPIELREAIYQCAPIIGFPKVLNAMATVNEAFGEKGISLPLAKQETVTEENRSGRGGAIRQSLYGDDMESWMKDVPGDMGADVARFLTEVQFGDFYTRNGLDLQTRELLTYCVLTVIGAEEELHKNLPGNLKAGNSKETLTAAVIQCMPYIGFPAALKAMKIIKEVPYMKNVL